MRIKDNKDYNYYTNLAELAIINSDFNSSKIAYKKAFKTLNTGFSDDFFNAIKVAILCKDVSFAYQNAEKLAQLGICEEFFDQFDLLKKDSIKWGNLMLLTRQKAKVNDEYRSRLETMFNEDQSVRGDRSNPKLISDVDSMNYQLFRQLLQLYGYPSENNIGIECSENLKGIQYSPQDVMLTHFSQREYIGVDSLLLEAWSDKKITPHECARYLELFNYPTKYYPDPVAKIDGIYYTFRLSDSLRTIVNENRRSLGMESIENHIKKIKYILDNNDTNFRFYAPINQYPLSSQEWLDATFVALKW